MTLQKIREAFDRNYQETLKIIDQMGGELNIHFIGPNEQPSISSSGSFRDLNTNWTDWNHK